MTAGGQCCQGCPESASLGTRLRMTEIRGSDPGEGEGNQSTPRFFRQEARRAGGREPRRPQETEAEEMRELGD